MVFVALKKFGKKILSIRLLQSICGYIFLIFKYSYHEMTYRKFREKYGLRTNFKFGGEGIIFYGNGKIEVGEGTHVGRFSSIQAYEGYAVKIGKNCDISHFVKIYTYNLEANQDFGKLPRKARKGNVIIGDNCWIGANVFIREGVTIGENSVIGANSVVTKDIPANVIAAGCPARVIKEKR